jgi:hypothetical protein
MADRVKSGMMAGVLAAAVAVGVAGCQPDNPQGGVGAPGTAARTADGKPDFSGIWQANNEAHWDLQAHEARPAILTQEGVYPYDYARVPAAPFVAMGAAAGVPGSLGVVEGDGQIPYKPEAAIIKKANGENWIDRDPELKCYLPGVPRAMYMPYPFSITQGTQQIQMGFTFSNAARVIHMDPKTTEPPDDTYMGFSIGRWEGDSLIVDTNKFNGRNWLDRAGNYHSDKLKLTEKYTLQTPDVIKYEVTIEDPDVYTQPWKISMPIYRRMEPNAQLLDYRCIEFAEEFMYGNLRRQQLVKRWEGDTMIIDITRKVPPGDKLHEWYRR